MKDLARLGGIGGGHCRRRLDLALPHREDAFHLVVPEAAADQPSIRIFREWLRASVGPRGTAAQT